MMGHLLLGFHLPSSIKHHVIRKPIPGELTSNVVYHELNEPVSGLQDLGTHLNRLLVVEHRVRPGFNVHGHLGLG